LKHEILQVEAHLHLLHFTDDLEKLVRSIALRFFRFCREPGNLLCFLGELGIETIEFTDGLDQVLMALVEFFKVGAHLVDSLNGGGADRRAPGRFSCFLSIADGRDHHQRN